MEGKTAASYMALSLRLGANPYVRPVAMCMPHRTQMVKARHRIVEEAFERDMTHILWLDDDMVVMPDVLDRLAIHQKAIVGGLCHKRLPPYSPLVLHRQKNDKGEEEDNWWWDHPEHGLHEVLGTGFGCLLTATQVFHDMDPPWFEEKTGGAGSDLYFCSRAREAGHQVYVDFDVDVKHLGQREEAGSARRREWVQAHPEQAQIQNCVQMEQAEDRAHTSRPGTTIVINPFD